MMRSTRSRLHRALAVSAAAGLAVTLSAGTAVAGSDHTGEAHGQGTGHDNGKGQHRTTDIQILSFNDFHGNLEPPSGSSGRLDHGGTPRRGDPTTGTRTRPRPAPWTPEAWSTSPPTSSRPARATQHRHGGRRRPHRRVPAAVGRLPRRADHRGDERARPRRLGRGQPRVRRGLHASSSAWPNGGCIADG